MLFQWQWVQLEYAGYCPLTQHQAYCLWQQRQQNPIVTVHFSGLHSPRCHPTRDILLDSQPLDRIPLLSCILTLLRTEVKSNSQDLPFHGPRFWLREMSLSSGTWRSLSTLAGVPGPYPPLGKCIRVLFSLSFINHSPKGSTVVSGWSGLQIYRAGLLAEAPSYWLKLAEDISPDR